ncbi:MAG: CRISPR-associated endonuclease Cas2 [Rectinema sp.]|nr:CRISPR-associated endonuclease Cas2 [Rectinema sp.]
MWAFVLFDLPVITKAERKAAARFRNDLLDFGFSMVQLSVYCKLTSGQEECESLEHKIRAILPKEGKVEIIYITDKQYENIISFHSGTENRKKKPQQLELF